MSTAFRAFSDAELESLLTISRRNNTALGVTGLLVYKDLSFLQVLEGEQGTVEGLYSKILRDVRHQGCSIFIQETKPAREFADWSMAFRDLSSGKGPDSEGFNDVLQSDRTDLSVFPSKVRAFMRMFVS